MERITISRDDRYHEAWPSLCVAPDGAMVCAYAEADVHGGGAVPSAVVRRSTDEGRSWSDPIVVDALMDGPQSGYMMCRAIVALGNGDLLLGADWYDREYSPPPGAAHNWGMDPLHGPKSEVWLYRSGDGGTTWSGPERTGCLGWSMNLGVLSDGRVYISGAAYHTAGDYESQHLYFSSDHGRTWSDEVVVLDDPTVAVSEGDIAELDEGLLVTYMRVERGGVPAGLKSISSDGGRTWSRPYRAGRWPLVGRVSAGRLSTGEVLVCHRVGGFALERWYGYFIDSAEEASSPTDGRAAIWGVLDNDTSPHADWGYGDWLELPDGDVYAVNYIVGDAPPNRPQIRGYRISREELFADRRPERLIFASPTYRRGKLESQDGWVRQKPELWLTRGLSPGKLGSLGNYAVVDPQGSEGRRPTITGTRNIGGGEEVLRRGIGPFDLKRESLRVSIVHTGRQQWCMLRTLDASGRSLVELRSDFVRDVLWARDADGGEYLSTLACETGWWCTRIDLGEEGIRLSTGPADGETTEWALLPLRGALSYRIEDHVNPDLRAPGSLDAVVSGIVLVIGGRGRFDAFGLEVEIVGEGGTA